MLRFLCRKQGKTIIVVTHDPSVASYADRMIGLKDGDIIEDRLLHKTYKSHPPFVDENEINTEDNAEGTSYAE